jgi:hypothetical protein
MKNSLRPVQLFSVFASIFLFISLGCSLPSFLTNEENSQGTDNGNHNGDPLETPEVNFDYSLSPSKVIEFPEETISYPQNWPENFIFPDEFQLVDTNSGISDITESNIWASKYTYNGQLDNAVSDIENYLNNIFWNIDFQDQDDEDYIFIISDMNSDSTGLIYFGPDENGTQINIIVEFFN